MSKTISLSVGVILIVLVGGFVYSQKRDALEKQMIQQAAAQQPSSQQGKYTLADIAQHGGRSSCWSTINGGVYDLTAWIPKHPGGEQAILSICGIDGSARFNAQHGGASLQQQILAGFKIGTLAK